MRKRLTLLLSTILMLNSTCRAGCVQNAELPVEAFKGHTVFVWEEKSIYQFVWLLDTDALIERKIIAGKTPVSECIVEANLNKMKGLRQFIKVFFIENPHFSTFIDDLHDPMQPREEFSDLIERLSILAKKNEIEIIFIDSHNNKKNGGGF